MDQKSLEFALKLYNTLPSEGNLFFSPTNIWMALAMAAVGAHDNTRDQMNEILGLTGLSDAKVVAKIREMSESFYYAREIMLLSAARIYAEQSNEFVQEYFDLMSGIAGLERVNFARKPDEARAMINLWVREHTQEKIKEILPDHSVTDLTLMVLVAAIYFKGDWVKKFDRKYTKPADFFAPSGTISVDMMHQTADDLFGFMHGDNFDAVSLPYKGDRLSMVALLPDEGITVREFAEDLTPARLLAALSSLGQRAGNLSIYMPKFTVDSGTFSVAKALKELGMTDAFTQWDADFTGMDENGRVYISDVYHRAWGRTDEEGSEMAAATAVAVMREAAYQPLYEVRLDRPYIYMVVDSETGTVLFMGRNEKPEA